MLFLAVAEHKSFTTAAAKLDVTLIAVRKAIRHLEQRHAVILFQRTTRRLALTEAGASLYARLRPATEEIGAAFAALGGDLSHRASPTAGSSSATSAKS
ncbi:LysR family transcriptional regulator [Polaromonas jejuensis]|uniref:LysR family transcriptional regulator n=1 Tax=Polaromonas jejuensis TaxID=457502 RepID=UPI002480B8D9|nr:LysR family transcriptional regulator [Polaromonas jejuensis]